MEGKIRQKHEELAAGQPGSPLRRLARIAQFFLYTLLYGFHRSFFVLFTSPQKSFALVGRQREDGVWVTSYDQHVQFARHLRVFSVTSPVIIVTATIVVFAAVQLLFPLRNTPAAEAASFTCAVTSYANAGAGSLRSCINFANTKDPGDDITIELGPFGAPPGVVTLATPLPTIARQVTFENQHAFIAITVNGSGLAGGEACLSLAGGASDSLIEGIAFRDCPVGIEVADGAGSVSGLSVGAGTSLARRVHIYGGTTGLYLSSDVSDSVVRNVIVGERPNGVNSPLAGVGVTIRGNGILVQDSVIGNATEGIFIQGDNNLVRRTAVGITAANEDRGNTLHGILVEGDNNTIGTAAQDQQNVISFNDQNGIAIIQGVGDPSPTGNSIGVNRIGTLTGGAATAANGLNGIYLSGDTDTVIGDSAAGTGPLVSGNTDNGILAENSTSPDILASSIGLSFLQETLAGNPQDNGIVLDNSTSATVRGNLVSGNNLDGIQLTGGTSGVVAGNTVGLKTDQSTARGNQQHGISLDTAGSVTIGGPTAADKNVVGDSGDTGVRVANANGLTIIQKNTVGVSGAGNTENGIQVEDILGGSVEVRGNTVQGTTGGALGTGVHLVRAHNALVLNNTTRGNFGAGIFLNETDSARIRLNQSYNNGTGIQLFEADNNTLRGNVVGIVTQSGAAPGNTHRGIAVRGDSQGNTIGGLLAADRNVVSGHTTGGAVGIQVESLAGSGNVIKGNYIGTTINGQAAAANGVGIIVEAPNQVIHTNLVSGNNDDAIRVTASNVVVRDNLIGVAADEQTPLGNGGAGLSVGPGDAQVILRNRLANNRSGLKLVGTTNSRVEANVIHRNQNEGIQIKGASSGAVVVGNRIGVTPNDDPAGNGVGIIVSEGSHDIRIGSLRGQEDNVGARNTISFNRLVGVVINGTGTNGVLVSRNTMVGNGDGVRDNIRLLNGANNGVTPPVITEVTIDRVRGTNALPSGSVQLFRNGTYLGQDLFPQADGRWSVRLQQTISAAAISAIQFAAINVAPNGSTSAFSKPEGGPTSTDAQQGEPTKDPDYSVSHTAAPGSTTADFTVGSSVPTTVEIRYGADEFNLAGSVVSSIPALQHALELVNLEERTKYYYQITATDESGVQVVSGLLSFSTTAFDVQYLFTDTTVNNQRVYDRHEVLYVNPEKPAQLRVGEVNPEHQVKLSVKEVNPGSLPVVEAKPFQDGSGGLVGGSFTVEKGKLYRGRAKVRQAADPTETTRLKRIATFAATAPAPHITSLSGPFTITPDSRRLSFAGDAGNRQGQFRIVDFLTGAEVAVGQTNADGVYELPFDLKVGEYTVNFEGLLNDGGRTAPRQHRLFVADPRRTTTTLNTDSRAGSPGYFDRLVSARTQTLTVVAITDLEAKLLIDGRDLGFMTRTSPVGLQSEVNLAALGLGTGDHVVEIQRFSADAKPYGARIWHPFKVIPGVVTPVVQLETGASFTQFEEVNVTVLGGKNDRLNVFRDGILIQSQIIPDTGQAGVIGSVQITLPTDQVGEEVLTVQAENSFGARSSAVEVRYLVTAQPTIAFSFEPTPTPEEPGSGAAALPEGDSGTAEPEPTEEPEPTPTTPPEPEEPTTEPTEEPTEEPVGPTTPPISTPPEPAEPTEPSVEGTTAEVPEEMEEAGITPTVLVAVPLAQTQLNDEGQLPEAYQDDLTDSVAVEQLYNEMNTANAENLSVTVERWVIDEETGALVSSETIEPEADGRIVLQRRTTFGLPRLEFLPFYDRLSRLPFFADPKESDLLVLSGTTTPYAKVIVVVLSDPIVKVTRADSDGKWTMTVDVNELPEGEHVAYLATESQGVRSDQLEIARFVVEEERQLSNTSWVFIVNMAVAASLLVVTITLQVRSRRLARRVLPVAGAAMSGSAVTPPATPPTNLTSTPAGTTPSTPPVEPKPADDSDTPTHHGALGV